MFNTQRSVSIYIEEYFDTYQTLSDFPYDELCRQIVEDINRMVNYTLTYILNTDTQNSAPMIDNTLSETMAYCVRHRAASGIVMSTDDIIKLKASVNGLCLNIIDELGAHQDWFNHHLAVEHAVVGGAQFAPTLALSVKLGEVKFTDHSTPQLYSRLSPQVMAAIQMMVARL